MERDGGGVRLKRGQLKSKSRHWDKVKFVSSK